MTSIWRSWARTDVGSVRSSNEDNYCERPEIGLWMVADGAGGHQHGEVASQLLVDSLKSTEARAGSDLIAEVRTVVARAHETLRSRAEAEAAGTGTPVMIASTIVVLLASDCHYACLWAGDSRIYRLRDGRLEQLTRDHSLVQALVDEGAISAADAESHPHANVVTRAIGADGPDAALDKVTGRAEPGDRFLLCSDGLNKALDDKTIAHFVGAQEPAERLIEAALAVGVRDNVTAIVVEFQPQAQEDDDDATLLRKPALPRLPPQEIPADGSRNG